MEILDHEHRGLATAARGEHARQERSHLPLARLGIGTRCRPLRVADAHELEHERQLAPQGVVQQYECAGDLASRLGLSVALGDAEVGAHELQHAQQRYALAVGHAVRLEGRDAPGSAASEELVREATLADARLRDEGDDVAAPCERCVQRFVEHERLLLTADESREASRARHVESRPHRSDARELEHTNRPAHALDRELTELDERGSSRPRAARRRR